MDELPDAVKLDTPFGAYSTSYEVKDSLLQRNGVVVLFVKLVKKVF